jgi:thermostable 8-oxoguanine DNA glycosylase
MIVHISVGVKKENGKWVGRWTNQESETLLPQEILANRREELERKMDKALRLAFPKASYIVQHRELTDAQYTS